MNDIYYFMLSYGILLVIFFALINWLSNGFFTTFIRVKASRGKKVLVNVRSKLQHYFVIGKIEGEFLVFNDRESKANKQKTPKRITVPSEEVAFYRSTGVNCVNVDEATNKIILPSGTSVSGFDAIKWNNLFIRALLKPSIDKKEDIIRILTFVGILVVVVGLFLVYSEVQTVKEVLINMSSVGGVNV